MSRWANAGKHLRGLLKWAGILTGLLVLTVALVVLLAVTWLQTPSGESFLRKEIEEQANATIFGRLEVDRVQVRGLLRVQLDGVRLFAPGDPVAAASVDRVAVNVHLMAILTRHIDVRELLLDRPQIHLIHVGDTTSLARALIPRHPATSEKETMPSRPPHLIVSVPALHIRNGSFDSDGDSPVALSALDLDGAVSGTLDDLDLSVALHTHLSEPAKRDAVIDLRGHYGDTVTVELLSLRFGDSHAVLSGFATQDLSRAMLRIEELDLAACDVNAFAPAAKLASDLSLKGQATLTGRDATVSLSLQPGPGEVTLDASAKLGAKELTELIEYRADVRTDGVEPHRIQVGLPVATLKVHATVKGAGMPLQGTAEVMVDASGSRFKKLLLDTVRLNASLKKKTAEISTLALRAAQVDVNAKGSASDTDSNLNLTIDAPSLARTRSLLMSGLGLDLAAMKGSAHANGHLEGPYANPRLTMKVAAPEIVVGKNAVKSLQFFANLSRLRPSPVGSFNASALSLRLGKRTGSNLWIGGEVDGHRADVDAKGELGGKPVQLVIRGEREAHTKKLEQWSFTQFEGTALGLGMAQQQPMRLAYGGGRLRIQDVRITGDLGQLALDADVGAEGSEQARLRIDGLHLEKVPADILPDGLNLAGAVALGVDLKGTLANPQVDATIGFQNGRFRGVSNLALNGDLHFLRDRLSGKMTATVSTGRIDLAVNAPVRSFEDAFKRGAPSAPVSLTLSANKLPLHDLALLAPNPVEASGSMTGRLEVQGTLQAPLIEVDWKVDDASAANLQNLFADLRATYAKGAWLADVKATHKDTLDLKVNARIELPIDDLLLDDELKMREREVSATVRLSRVDLAWLNLVGYGPPDLAGTLAGQVTLTGTLGKPEADGTIKATGLAGAGYRNVDAIVDLSAANRIEVTGDAWMSGHPLAEFVATLKDSAGHLATLGQDDLLATPLAFKAMLAKTDLDQLLPIAAPIQGEKPSPFRSLVEGRVEVTGTLNDPKANLHVAIDELMRADGPTGVLTTDLEYAEAKTTLKALFHSDKAGDLRLNGGLNANLGATALRKTGEKALRGYTGDADHKPSAFSAGLSTALATPTTITVDADQFDLALANGYSTTIRNLGGHLDLHLKKTGPLIPLATDGSLASGSPLSGLGGTIALSKGQLAMLGTGSFSDISLKASGQYPSLTLEELKGKAGNGSFDVNANLEQTGGPDFQGKLAVALKDFPVIENFQTRGFLSLKLDASGTGNAQHVKIPLVTIREGHMLIPEKLPRKIQTLQPHPDIELANQKPKEEATAKANAFTLQVDKIDVPNDFVVDAPLGNKLTLGANLKMAYDPAFMTEGDSPLDLTGKVQVVRGDLSLLRKFEVDQGEVTFYPHDMEDPAVTLKAHYDGPDAKVNVSITGTLQNPERHFDSTPQMEENEILYYLATGQRQTRPQQTDSANLQTQLADATISALGAAAIGVVQGAVQQLLPSAINPDVLSVETDLQHSGIGRVRAGKYYFKGKLYVGGQYNPSANPLLNENTYEGEAEYRLGGSQYLRLLVGNEGHHQLYYLIERSFPTIKQRRNGVR